MLTFVYAKVDKVTHLKLLNLHSLNIPRMNKGTVGFVNIKLHATKRQITYLHEKCNKIVCDCGLRSFQTLFKSLN